MVSQIFEVNCRNRDNGGSKGNKRQRAHADRFAGKIPIESNQHSNKLRLNEG